MASCCSCRVAKGEGGAEESRDETGVDGDAVVLETATEDNRLDGREDSVDEDADLDRDLYCGEEASELDEAKDRAEEEADACRTVIAVHPYRTLCLMRPAALETTRPQAQAIRPALATSSLVNRSPRCRLAM